MSLAKLIKDACHDKSKNTLVFTPDTLYQHSGISLFNQNCLLIVVDSF